ncbi:uncharacterized protein LOC124680609 isoform X3 [Lolium rigidum]|uniref:uncharacterized protein LOC124680609 isoform X3 n=1 Tax=Lolium rigidum TaxID=89674 RepID=UPI001F5D73D7|nr:uncharacterized protein LOC124680609 isoform X3 [Lolium rigidum]XP_047071635.1 uncharacterized protein LOC124680609 isoform X3 [Lolium rigidum]
MAPSFEATPRRAETTERCASSSSTSWCEESFRSFTNRAQRRRFPESVAVHLLQFRPPSSSSGQTEHTPGVLVFRRTPDVLALVLFRSQPSSSSPTRGFRHGLSIPSSARVSIKSWCSSLTSTMVLQRSVIVARYASITVEPFHFQHQMQQPDDLLDLMLNGPQPRPSDAAR